MPQPKRKTVLFLGAGNYCRSRFAEILFNSVAKKMGLEWQASSSGLSVTQNATGVGPMAPAAVQTLEALGIRAADAATRFPSQATPDDFDCADRVVALSRSKLLPLLQAQFPARVETVEFWHVEESPDALNQIEREVMGLVARFLGGGARSVNESSDHSSSQRPPAKASPTKQITLKVGRETAGRRGKGVTTVFDTPLNERALLELAGTLKQRCGTGGTVKDGRIEIQGDQRERIVAELEKLGFKVKRAGG